MKGKRRGTHIAPRLWTAVAPALYLLTVIESFVENGAPLRSRPVRMPTVSPIWKPVFLVWTLTTRSRCARGYELGRVKPRRGSRLPGSKTSGKLSSVKIPGRQ